MSHSLARPLRQGPRQGPALATVVLLLAVTAATTVQGQGLDTVAIFQAGVQRVDFLDSGGASVAFALLSGTPAVGARAADGTLWVGTTTPTQLIQVGSGGAVLQQVPLPATPGGIAVDAAGNVWVTLLELGHVQVYSTNAILVTTYAVGQGPRGIAIDSGGGGWVANSLGGSVSRITSGLVFTYTVSGSPFGVAVHPAGGVWITNLLSNVAQHLAPSGLVTDNIAVGQNPQGIAIDGEGRIWVVTTGDNSLWQLSALGAVEAIHAVGTNPRGVAVGGDGGIWVTASGSDEVHRIDPRTSVHSVHTGFFGADSFGDGTGFARAHVVDPAADVDLDGHDNLTEITYACNPLRAQTTALGRFDPQEVSVEGNTTVSAEGCGFLALTVPRLLLGSHECSSVVVIDDHHLQAVTPAASVSDSLEAALLDDQLDVDTLASAVRYLRNPGQAWITGSTTTEWLRVPIDATGELGAARGPYSLPFVAAAVAVDDLGGVWLAAGSGGAVHRWSSDGVQTDSWTLPVTAIGGIAIGLDGAAWLTSRGTPGTVYRLYTGSATIQGPFVVGNDPVCLAVGPDGSVWVSNEDDNTVSHLKHTGELLDTFSVGAEPCGVAIDLAGQAWVASRGAGLLQRLDSTVGVNLSIPVGASPTAVAVSGDGSVWVTLGGTSEIAKIDPTLGIVFDTWPTASTPHAVAIDGRGAIWVTHAGAGEVRRFETDGTLLDTLIQGSGQAQLGDFTGLLPPGLLQPTEDHDGDLICNGAEIQHVGDPFRPEVIPTNQVYFESIDPEAGYMVGGMPFVLTGCGFSSGNLNLLLGGNPIVDLTIIDDTEVTGSLPVSSNLGPADLVITADAGTVFVPEAFRYLTSPVQDFACEQIGVPLILTWSEPQQYDSVSIYREGVFLATVAPGVLTYGDPQPPLGAHEYTVAGVLQGEESDPSSCQPHVILVPPMDFTCLQQGGEIALSWTPGDIYTELVIERDAVPLATLTGTIASYDDVLPPLGAHTYTIWGTRDGHESVSISCVTDFTVLAVEGLQCIPDFGQVTLSWSEPQPFDSVLVLRNGVLLHELFGAGTTYVDSSVDEGPNGYEVIGVLQGVEGPGVICDIVVPVPAVTDLTCSAYVFDVTLQWSLGLPDYEQIRVLRDGLEIATLAGSTTSLFDAGVAVGPVQYEVIAERNGTLAAATGCLVEVLGPIFIRGDANGDTAIDLGDPIFNLTYQVGGGLTPSCFDAADTNDDGNINIADPIYNLTYQFQTGPTPPLPFPTRGPDPTPDTLDCAVSLPTE